MLLPAEKSSILGNSQTSNNCTLPNDNKDLFWPNRFKSIGEGQLKHGRKLILIPMWAFARLIEEEMESFQKGRSSFV